MCVLLDTMWTYLIRPVKVKDDRKWTALELCRHGSNGILLSIVLSHRMCVNP